MRIPRSFRWPAVIVMMLVTAAMTALNTRLVVTGYWNWRGLPFKWYEWVDYRRNPLYHWWAILADVALTMGMALVAGIITEHFIPRSKLR